MVSAANLQTQAYKFRQDTPAGRWYWTTYMDVSGFAPSFRVADIVSPYGILRDSIPIPGDIIEAMADSISQIRTQFPPEILAGPPNPVTITLDEGRGFGLPVEVTLTNSGVYGSLLEAYLTSSAAYLTVTPGAMGNLASNESGTFELAADSTNLLASGSPYSETITIQSDLAPNSPQTLPVSIVVRPKAEITATPETLTFNVVKPLSGSFPSVPTQTFTIENTGPAGSVLEWQLQRIPSCISWLQSYTPTSGTLLSGETQVVTVTVVPPDSTLVGSYEGTLRISGYSENQFVDVLLQLNVT